MTWGPRTQSSPTSPTGRSSPLSSRIAISVDGIGQPDRAVVIGEVDRVRRDPGRRFRQPVASITALPVTRFHFSATAFWTAMPPAAESLQRSEIEFARNRGFGGGR